MYLLNTSVNQINQIFSMVLCYFYIKVFFSSTEGGLCGICGITGPLDEIQVHFMEEHTDEVSKVQSHDINQGTFIYFCYVLN